MTCGLIILQDISVKNEELGDLKKTLLSMPSCCDIMFLSVWNGKIEPDFLDSLSDIIYNTDDVLNIGVNNHKYMAEFNEIIFIKGSEVSRFTKVL